MTMYADRMLLEDPNNLRDESEDFTVQDESSSLNLRQGGHRDSIGPCTSILILGPSGSGKSSLINLVSDEKRPVASQGAGLCTAEFGVSQSNIANQSFRLIDSPGLDTNSYSNFDIFKQLVLFLFAFPDRLSGILYLHPEDGNLGSDKLKGNIEAIKCLFGSGWLHHLTIALVTKDVTTDSAVITPTQDHSSPLRSFHSAGAKIRCLNFQPTNVHEILLEFSSKRSRPKAPRFYAIAKPRDSHGRFQSRVDYNALDRLIDQALGPRRDNPPSPVGRRPHRMTLEESEENRQQLQLALNKNEEELQLLRAQLEQVRLEYGSLRSELQLHDNTEQNKVVQSMKDLNRSIDNFSRIVAQHLVDNYIVPHTEDIDSVTTLQALSLPDLKIQFEHQDGAFSLVASSSGTGMPIEDFIDLALRSILCRRLYEGIFLPFHPMLTAEPEITFMATLYDGVRRHAPQNVAAKWRASSFVALSKEKSPEARKGTIEAQVERIMKDDISKLIDNFFGQEKGVLLTEHHHHRLKEIVGSAWDWNDILKGDVVTLGDFQPAFYGPGAPFDVRSMLEFEPDKSRESPPDTVICTIGLGLSLFHSKAQGDTPGPIAVCKAIVATEHFYTRS